jgi:flavin-dependent dehydrogenase
MEVKGKQDLLPPMDLRDLALSTKIKSSNRRWRVFRPVCSEGILLCGDAAGIIDPAAGQGILNAMLSAIRAVRTINSCLHEPHLEAMHLAAYDDWFISDYMDKVGKLKYFYSLHNIKLFNPAKTRIKS